MAEMAWLRRLARELVREDMHADDVARNTLLVAADQPFMRTRSRTDARRDGCDPTVDAPRALPTPDELVERLVLQRAVAEEVLALAEPYRSTVLLHFLQGLSNAELGAHHGISAGTVRRRLKLAIYQLREALRRRANPPPRGWLASLDLLAKSPTSNLTPAVEVRALKKLVAIVVLILLASTVRFMWRNRDVSVTMVLSAQPRPPTQARNSDPTGWR